MPNSGRDETRRAIEAAQEAFESFRKTSALERSQLLRKMHQVILDNQEELAQLLSMEQGKSLFEARGEVGMSAAYVLWYAEEARRTYGDVVPSPWRDRRIMVTKEPIGVVCSNHPMELPIIHAGPQNCSGNRCRFAQWLSNPQPKHPYFRYCLGNYRRIG